MNILGIDPGLRACGVASVTGEGHWYAGTIRPKTRTLQERIQEIVRHMPRIPWDLIVIEMPQIYQGYKQEGDPNDLLRLSLLVGALIVSLDGEILLPLPSQWKGQVPKEIHHRRIRARVPGLGRQSKDAMDAVGLALYGVDHVTRSKTG